MKEQKKYTIIAWDFITGKDFEFSHKLRIHGTFLSVARFAISFFRAANFSIEKKANDKFLAKSIDRQIAVWIYDDSEIEL